MGINSLATLIKLQKTLVDEQRQHVAMLQDKVDQIENMIAQIELHKAREQAAATDDAARATYGEYLRRMVGQTRVLQKERHAAAMAVRIAQGRLAELFEEQKRYEIAEEARLKKQAQEELRKETQELDEIGIVMHERRKTPRD